jgi:hypothetical protein
VLTAPPPARFPPRNELWVPRGLAGGGGGRAGMDTEHATNVLHVVDNSTVLKIQS